MISEFDKLELPKNHYIHIARELKSEYFSEFIKALENLELKLSKKDFIEICDNKLQLNNKEFDEKKFIQGACEVAVANYFRNKENFKIEVKINPLNKKDVDCQFKSNGFTYNIEVKCASFDAKENVEQNNSYKYVSYGRLDNRNDIISIISKALDEGHKKQGKPLMAHEELKNMDNNLKDFLVSANKKFNPECNENEINILLIGCNDKADMQSWVGYLKSARGMFTPQSYVNKKDYENVDIVVFTNLYYKHKDYFNKSVKDSWSLSSTLNLYIENPFSAKNKKSGILNFNNEIINYNHEINQFDDIGDVPDGVKDVVRIPHFVIKYLEQEKNIYLFETPK